MDNTMTNFRPDTKSLKKGTVYIYSYNPKSGEDSGVFLAYVLHTVDEAKVTKCGEEFEFGDMYCFSGNNTLEGECLIDSDEEFKYLKVFNYHESKLIEDMYFSGENDEYKMDIVLEFLAQHYPEYVI